MNNATPRRNHASISLPFQLGGRVMAGVAPGEGQAFAY
jgi:hypothetical protein